MPNANQENREEEFSGNLGDSDEPIMEVQNEGEMHAETENAALASRTRQPPSYLKDYYCHPASHDPLCMSLSQPPSSGKVYPITNYLNYNWFSPRHQAYLAAVMSHEELRNYREAIQKPKWQEAMAQELKALEDNETWDVALPPKGNKVMGCKWVYKVKYKALGEVEKYKVRLVAKGYTQVEGEDFNETFAPVAKMTTVRCLPSIAIARDWELHQMDVSNAFLHGDLEEEVYMQAPEGYKVPKEGMVCRLKKSLYGLRQASRNWYSKLSQAPLEYGFQESHTDHNLFTYSSDSTFMAVLVYVDDLVIAGNNSQVCTSIKGYLSTCFHMKDLGPLKYFL